MKTVFVIYSLSEQRPVVMAHNFGSIIVYLNEEAALAYIATQKQEGKEGLFAKQMRLEE